MEKIKCIIKDTKKTVLISLIASIFIVLLDIKYRTFSILQLIIMMIPSILFIIYYTNVALKLYKNKGNVILVTNILLIAYSIYAVLSFLIFLLQFIYILFYIRKVHK